MDDDVKAILSDLCGAINDRLDSSTQITANVKRLEALGYKMSLFLEASILLTRDEPNEASEPNEAMARTKPTRKIKSGSLSLNDKDLTFLKSLKIALDPKKLPKPKP